MKDLMGIPIYVGETILAISGIDRTIEIIESINEVTNSILTEEGNVYFSGNILGVEDIKNNNAEYFV